VNALGTPAEHAGPPRSRAAEGAMPGRTGRSWFLGAVAAIQAGFVALNVAFPGSALIDLDGEHNAPTYFQAGLLATAALLAAWALRVEEAVLARTGERRGWALASWAGAAALFAAMALDEALVLHEQFNTDAVRAAFRPTSAVQGTVVWLVVLAPAIVAAMAGLLGWLLARGAASRRFVGTGLVAVWCWLVALALEGTAKSIFIPLNLYRLEVALEESAEALAPAIMCVAIAGYVTDLRRRLAGTTPPPLRLAVPWRRLAAVTAVALALPAAVVAGSIALNPAVRLRAIADEHLRAGRLDEAREAYRAVVARRPAWARAWDRLGVVEYGRRDLDAAAAAFATAARLSPRDGSVLQHLGAVRYGQGRYAEAVLVLERARALQPRDPETLRSLAAALARVGRDSEAEALRRRASAIEPERARVTAARVMFPAPVALAYLGAPRLAPALRDTEAGRIEAALAGYRAAAEDREAAAAAQLALGNELVRWHAAARLAAARQPVRVAAGGPEPGPASVLFSDWVRSPAGTWTPIESVVSPPALPPAGTDLADAARRHYERALALGAGAAARVGLAALARLAGQSDEAAHQLAAARALDPTLPAAFDDVAIRDPRP